MSGLFTFELHLRPTRRASTWHQAWHDARADVCRLKQGNLVTTSNNTALSFYRRCSRNKPRTY